MKDVVRLGGGSAHGRDIPEPAIALAESGQVDYLVFDGLSEKGLLDLERNHQRHGQAWDPYQETRMRRTIPPCAATKTKIITNMGAADPYRAAIRIGEICREVGARHLKVLAVVGDNVLGTVKKLDPVVAETGQPASAFGDKLVVAYAYVSGQGIVEALRRGADIVVSGRVGDSTQFLAPLIHEFGWADHDWDRLGKGLGIGHIMECAAQVTGGYFADPPYKTVENLFRVGFPIAIVEPNGDAVITKLPGTGGLVNRQTVLEQMLYEIGDPTDYKHTDAVVDFTTTELTEVGPDRVQVMGTTGHPKPPTVKVCLGVHEGYMAVGRVMYGGEGAYERAQFAAHNITRRLEMQGVDVSKVHFKYLGINALFPWNGQTGPPTEVYLRGAALFPTLEEAEMLTFEFNALASCTGAAGTACGRDIEGGTTEEIIGLYTTFLPQSAVQSKVVEVPDLVGAVH